MEGYIHFKTLFISLNSLSGLTSVGLIQALKQSGNSIQNTQSSCHSVVSAPPTFQLTASVGPPKLWGANERATLTCSYLVSTN